MTPKELGELGHLEAPSPVVEAADFPPLEADDALEPGQRKSVTILRGFAGLAAGQAQAMVFDFFAKPMRIEGDGKAERIIVERTELDENGARGARAKPMRSRRRWSSPHRLFDLADRWRPVLTGGKFVNERGRIADRLYAVGWARRGPSGTIGTNRPDGYEVADRIAAGMPAGSSASALAREA